MKEGWTILQCTEVSVSVDKIVTEIVLFVKVCMKMKGNKSEQKIKDSLKSSRNWKIEFPCANIFTTCSRNKYKYIPQFCNFVFPESSYSNVQLFFDNAE